MRIGCFNDAEGRYCIPKVMRTENAWERNRGLLGRPALVQSEAMLISPCNSVHTVGMRYPLDIVYLDRSLKVVKLVESVKPFRMSGAIKGFSTLELLEGEVKRLDIQLGDQMIWGEGDD